MRIRAAVSLCAFLLVCGVGWSQNRLNDVAGSIKLNPEAIVEKQGYVEDGRVAKKADHELLSTVLNGCVIVADDIGAMVEEARSTILYRDDVLPKRLTAATLDLDTQVQEIYLLRLTDTFAQPEETAREAAEACEAANSSIRNELARQGVAFTQAREEMTRCRKGLTRAQSELAAADQPAARPGGSGEVDGTAADEDDEPPSDEEIIAEICEPENRSGSDAFDACTVRQNRAAAALDSRTPENEMLDPPVFEEIRSICTQLHSRDFYLRDQCEMEKMTSVRLENE